ncbi:hypothetical protein DIPPA_20495 [Diplonema papillatum]|nr:hypothetical protein DIPPA_20495 [Diplonema papillatum]
MRGTRLVLAAAVAIAAAACPRDPAAEKLAIERRARERLVLVTGAGAAAAVRAAAHGRPLGLAARSNATGQQQGVDVWCGDWRTVDQLSPPYYEPRLPPPAAAVPEVVTWCFATAAAHFSTARNTGEASDYFVVEPAPALLHCPRRQDTVLGLFRGPRDQACRPAVQNLRGTFERLQRVHGLRYPPLLIVTSAHELEASTRGKLEEALSAFAPRLLFRSSGDASSGGGTHSGHSFIRSVADVFGFSNPSPSTAPAEVESTDFTTGIEAELRRVLVRRVLEDASDYSTAVRCAAAAAVAARAGAVPQPEEAAVWGEHAAAVLAVLCCVFAGAALRIPPPSLPVGARLSALHGVWPWRAVLGYLRGHGQECATNTPTPCAAADQSQRSSAAGGGSVGGDASSAEGRKLLFAGSADDAGKQAAPAQGVAASRAEDPPAALPSTPSDRLSRQLPSSTRLEPNPYPSSFGTVSPRLIHSEPAGAIASTHTPPRPAASSVLQFESEVTLAHEMITTGTPPPSVCGDVPQATPADAQEKPPRDGIASADTPPPSSNVLQFESEVTLADEIIMSGTPPPSVPPTKGGVCAAAPASARKRPPREPAEAQQRRPATTTTTTTTPPAGRQPGHPRGEALQRQRAAGAGAAPRAKIKGLRELGAAPANPRGGKPTAAAAAGRGGAKPFRPSGAPASKPKRPAKPVRPPSAAGAPVAAPVDAPSADAARGHGELGPALQGPRGGRAPAPCAVRQDSADASGNDCRGRAAGDGPGAADAVQAAESLDDHGDLTLQGHRVKQPPASCALQRHSIDAENDLPGSLLLQRQVAEGRPGAPRAAGDVQTTESHSDHGDLALQGHHVKQPPASCVLEGHSSDAENVLRPATPPPRSPAPPGLLDAPSPAAARVNAPGGRAQGMPGGRGARAGCPPAFDTAAAEQALAQLLLRRQKAAQRSHTVPLHIHARQAAPEHETKIFPLPPLPSAAGTEALADRLDPRAADRRRETPHQPAGSCPETTPTRLVGQSAELSSPSSTGEGAEAGASARQSCVSLCRGESLRPPGTPPLPARGSTACPLPPAAGTEGVADRLGSRAADSRRGVSCQPVEDCPAATPTRPVGRSVELSCSPSDAEAGDPARLLLCVSLRPGESPPGAGGFEKISCLPLNSGPPVTDEGFEKFDTGAEPAFLESPSTLCAAAGMGYAGRGAEPCGAGLIPPPPSEDACFSGRSGSASPFRLPDSVALLPPHHARRV